MKTLYCLRILAMTLLLSSCASVPPRHPLPPAPITIQPQTAAPSMPAAAGMIHVVAAGDTLYRLSRVYGVPIEAIMRANGIKDPSAIEKGSRLVIPPASSIITKIPLYRNNRWRYIIVHHSATDDGDARSLDRLHRRRGWNEIGYHFVIDNGTKGKADGEIEICSRWIKQQEGAHCRASSMNSKGIGICLVGNFSETKISEKQMASLAYLVNILKKYYSIPGSRIMGHGQVPGARTECPGKYFPWQEFRSKLEGAS